MLEPRTIGGVLMKIDADGDPVRFWWKPSPEQGDADWLETTVAFLPREGADLEWVEWVEWASQKRSDYKRTRPRTHPTVRARAVAESGH